MLQISSFHKFVLAGLLAIGGLVAAFSLADETDARSLEDRRGDIAAVAAGGDIRQADRLAATHAQSAPDDVAAQVLAGTLALNLGHLARAASHFRVATTLGPSAAAWTGLAVIDARRGALRDAEVQLRRALALDPLYAPALSKLSRLLALRGDVDNALMLSSRALALDAETADHHADAAVVYHCAGRLHARDNAVTAAKHRGYAQISELQTFLHQTPAGADVVVESPF